MGNCKFCEKESNEYWFSNFCENCRKIKNLANVYGFERVLTILEKCCIRDENQLENKIKAHTEIKKERLPSLPEEIMEKKVVTRSTKKEYN